MSEHEHLHPLAASLFEAARQERPSQGARRRTLEALEARTGRPRLRPMAAYALAGLAAAAAFAIVMSSAVKQPPELVVEAERVPLPEARPPESSKQPSPPAPASSEPQLPLAPPAPLPRTAPAPARPTLSLAEEVQALDEVRRVLMAGDAAQALRLLESRPVRRLGDEATLLRIEALTQTGRAQAADDLARRFVEANPTSPLTDRARALLNRMPSERTEDAGAASP